MRLIISEYYVTRNPTSMEREGKESVRNGRHEDRLETSHA